MSEQNNIPQSPTELPLMGFPELDAPAAPVQSVQEPAAEPDIPKVESTTEEPVKKYPSAENHTDSIPILSDYRYLNSIATDTAIIFVVCILLIYLILCALYESFFVPFAVILAVNFLALNFSTITLMLIAGAAGLAIFLGKEKKGGGRK